MNAAEKEFVDPKKVKSVIVHYHSVRKKTIKHWFSSEEVVEEVKTNSAKVLFSNGMPLKKENINYREDGIYRTRVIFQNGMQILSETTSPTGEVIERIETEYYPFGKKKEEITYKNGKLDSKYYYKYDYHNNLIELQSYYSWSFRLSEPTKYSWSYSLNNGNRVETKINNNNNTKTIYYFDDKNRIVKQYEYDEKGILIQSIESFFDSSGLEFATKLDGSYMERMKYDDHKNLIWMEWFPRFRDYSSDSQKKYTKAITIIEYIYDYRGNWIELRQFRDGVYNLLQTRHIEYID